MTEVFVGRILVLALAAALVFVVGILLEFKHVLHTEKLCHAAARWLANRNYVELAAYRDVIYRRYGVTLLDLRKDLAPVLGAKSTPYLAQAVSLIQVPKGLLQAALAYNKATDKLAGTRFEAQWLDMECETRVADLEAAVIVLANRKWADYVVRVAEGAGVSLNDVRKILFVYTSIYMAEAEQRVGTLQDPEEILPSIY
jgi:hypothetical protein